MVNKKNLKFKYSSYKQINVKQTQKERSKSMPKINRKLNVRKQKKGTKLVFLLVVDANKKKPSSCLLGMYPKSLKLTCRNKVYLT